MRTYSKEDDKENCEAAQEELEKGGMGSRKRLRVRGGKENISNALWQTSLVEEDGGDAMVMGSPKKMRMSIRPGDIDAFVVPRKRTNTNHLITPRKPGRKSHLLEQSQPTNTAGSPPKIFTYSPTKLSPQKIPLNDQEITHDSNPTCTPAKTALQKVALNDMDQTEEGATVPAEKLFRKRKSLRRSTRRLTHGTTPEQAPAAPAESTKANHLPSDAPAPTLETATEPTSDAEHSIVGEAPKSQVSVDYCFGLIDPDSISVEETHETLVPDPVQQQTALESAEAKSPSSQKEVDMLAGCPPRTPRASTGDLKKDSPILRSENIPLQASSTFQQDISNDAIGATTIITESFGASAKEAPESQSPVLNCIEIKTEIQFSSPTKASETPRQRRRTPQRRGSRRSTRTNRAESVPLENQPDHATPQIQNAHPNISPANSRMTKIPSKKSRRPSDQESAVEKHVSIQVSMRQDAEPAATASKQNVDVETRAQQGSTEIEGFVNTQPFGLSLQSEHADIMGSIIESISAEANYHFEDPNLAITPRVEGEIPSSGAVNVQAHSPFETGTATTFVPSKFGFFSPLQVPQAEELIQDAELPSHESRRVSLETLEVLEPVLISLSTEKLQEDSAEETPDELPGSSTPNPSTTELVETISENAPANTFEHDDTDMLRNFLTRVKANKAAKAGTSIPKRKRSLPHSPLRLPLGSVDSALSPSSPKSKDEFDVSLPVDGAAKRKLDDAEFGYDEATQPKSIRRSGRTRLPMKAAPLAAPSFIPVRRLGQDGDNTITLRRNEEKELAALTRINTRKNKAGAQLPLQVLAKQAEEKEDPASRQRALKEVFDEKALKQKKEKKGKSVVWAEELAQFQTEEGKMAELDKDFEKEKERAVPVEEKKNAVKVGVRSKMTLGMANNGTPAPKRKVRGRT
jgi:hypothetical protein